VGIRLKPEWVAACVSHLEHASATSRQRFSAMPLGQQAIPKI